LATEDFHQEAKSWAEIKHTLLARYLRLFVDKTGLDRDRVYYVDAFAGAGKLDDGTEGSPIYAAKLAASLTGKRQGVLKCINVEAVLDTFEALQQSTAEYVRDGYLINLSGRFDERRGEVLSMIGDAPALFFIDPFGTEGAELSALRELKGSGTIREVLVRYDDTRVKRLARWSANHLDSLDPAARKTAEAFKKRTSELTTQEAINNWFDGNPNAREDLIDGYIGEAKRQGIFSYGIAYPLRNPDTCGHRYFLVHLCNFPDGYIWIANFMNAAELDYEEQRSARDLFGGQKELITVRDLSKSARPQIIKRIVTKMPTICESNKWTKGIRVRNRHVYAAMVDEFGWNIGRNEREGALKQLKEAGNISCTGTKDSDWCTFNTVF
jgi:three-Cys-motif partner protein